MKKFLFLILVGLFVLNGSSAMAQESTVLWPYVEGDSVVGFNGNALHFRGVSLPSGEWNPWFEFDCGTIDQLAKMGANTVRFPLGQTYWLNNGGYPDTVANEVSCATDRGLFVFLDLHRSEGSEAGSNEQREMPDSNSLIFWTQVAERFGKNPLVVFELYNEPYDVSSGIWLNGGTVGGYTAVGMQQIVDAIRTTNAKNLIVANGTNWGFDQSDLGLINDTNTIYGCHPYGQFDEKNDPKNWTDHCLSPREGHPVMFTEFGDISNCDGSFYQSAIEYAEEKLAGWIAWAWYPESSSSCGFPGLTQDWNGNDLKPAGTIVVNWFDGVK